MKSKVKALPLAVTSWINYEKACGKKNVISELYLTKAIVDFLSSCKKGIVQNEYIHPVLKNKNVGKNSCIDYAIIGSKKKELRFALEVKVLNTSTNTTAFKQNIYNDIIKLRLIDSARHPNSVCFFMLIKIGVKRIILVKPKIIQFLGTTLSRTINDELKVDMRSNCMQKFKDQYIKKFGGSPRKFPRNNFFVTELYAESAHNNISTQIWRIKAP